jgi:hypothetical protein
LQELKKLAIVGTHAHTRDLAPYDDPSFDIWVFNEAGNHDWCKRWDAVFQMHEPEIYKGVNTKDPHHWEWLQKRHGKPIYMQELDPDVPDSVRFPLEHAIEIAGFRYFTATLAYTAALAILQGYTQVDVFGVELDANTEYTSQAECWRFWVGVMIGKGIDVRLHSGRKLFEATLYGYEGAFAFGSEYFKERAARYDSEWTHAEKSLQNIKKALMRAVENNEYEKTQRLFNDLQSAATATGSVAGKLAEAERYATFGDRYADRGGFEYAAAKAQRDGEEKRVEMLHSGGIVEYLWNAWKATKTPQAQSQMVRFIERYASLAYDTGALHGIYTDNLEYMGKFDDMVKNNGGMK